MIWHTKNSLPNIWGIFLEFLLFLLLFGVLLKLFCIGWPGYLFVLAREWDGVTPHAGSSTTRRQTRTALWGGGTTQTTICPGGGQTHSGRASEYNLSRGWTNTQWKSMWVRCGIEGVGKHTIEGQISYFLCVDCCLWICRTRYLLIIQVMWIFCVTGAQVYWGVNLFYYLYFRSWLLDRDVSLLRSWLKPQSLSCSSLTSFLPWTTSTKDVGHTTLISVIVIVIPYSFIW